MPKKTKTIKFSELKRLSFCNSPKLPKVIEIVGKIKGKTVRVFKEWVGIGWIELDPERHEIKDPVLVVDDGE